jgi:hypothetical protein
LRVLASNLLKSSRMYTCHECEQPINQATEVCPYCGADLTEVPLGGDAEKPRKKSAARVVILWAVVLLSLAGIAWFAFPWRLAGSKPEAEAHAVAAITALEQALNAYQTSEATFPSALESLGDRGQEALQEAQSGRYTLQYAPGNPESDGRVKSYTLTARAGNYGYVNLFADETGVVRGTRENRAAGAADPRIDAVSLKAP